MDGGTDMIPSERAKYIYDVCRAAGMTYAGAIGMLGNLQGEASDFDPMSVEGMSDPNSYLRRIGLTEAEYTRRAEAGVPTYDGKYFAKDSKGYGIVQWTYWARKQGLLDFAKAAGKSVGDLDVQIAYMLKELTEHYTPTWQVLTTTDSIAKAVNICVTNYEKPTNQADAISRRTAYANAWSKLIPDGGTAEPSAPAQDSKPAGESYDRRKVVELALAEIGYLEKKSADYLDNQTANAGSANYTKYARDLDAIGDFYNGKKQGYAWCDVFVDWCFVQAYGVEAALKLLCAKPKSSGAGCTYSLNYFIRAGQFHKRGEKPEVGDQIFFGSVGNSSHTGLVYKVDDTTVYTVEGNTSGADGVVPNGGAVCRKSYPLTSSAIAGYGRPKYSDGFTGGEIPAEDKPEPTPEPEPEKPEESVTAYWPPRTLHQGMTGGDVEVAQAILKARGGDVIISGEFDARFRSRLMQWQSYNGLAADGIIGAATWAALLRR